MQNAIEKAIEGGYADHAYCNEFDMYECDTSYCHSTVLLDPLFWQALKLENHYYGGMVNGYFQDAWKFQWHRFIDHIANGGEIDLFFKELLK